jgi:hypothetical protein
MTDDFRLLRTLMEGGWASTATQHTQITPQLIATSVTMLEGLVDQFNRWLSKNHPHVGTVEVGPPTGSGHYYHTDPPTKEYGDIDIQMVAINPWRASHSSYGTAWNKLWDLWVAEQSPSSISKEHSTPGHPFLKIGDNQIVQVDFMWHEPHLQAWGLVRSVPPRGLKGMLHGNLFSVLGSMLMMSLQHSGAQIKTSDGVPVPFSKQKGVDLVTVSQNPSRFLVDLVEFVAGQPIQQLKIDPLLQKNPGLSQPGEPVEKFVDGIYGLARTFELNNLYGQGILKDYANAHQFLKQFWHAYETKAHQEIINPKRLKAATPAAQARAERDIDLIRSGLQQVSHIWHGKTG